MKTTLLILTALQMSAWVGAGSEHTFMLNLLRHRRSISESTRFHNEYDNGSDRNTENTAAASPNLSSCVPGTTWKNDCNSCWCSRTRVAACTLMACLNFDENRHATTKDHHSLNSIQEHDNKNSRVRRADEENTGCVPGTTWKQDCNTCRCIDTGKVACTKRGCFHMVTPLEPVTNNRKKRSGRRIQQSSTPGYERPCKKGSVWMWKCNSCHCLGERAVCTRMQCPDE